MGRLPEGDPHPRPFSQGKREEAVKLASLKGPARDGTLVVVNRDLTRAVAASGIAPTMQHALENWDGVHRKLVDAFESLECGGEMRHATWGGDLTKIDFDRIVYYRKPSEREEKSWDDVPEKIKATFEKLGIPEAERKFLAGVGAQYDSEVVYHSVREELSKIGVVFMGTDQALKEHPEIFRQYFGTIIPPSDNKFAALNSAVWSGGSFIYVPKGVKIDLPLQAYFRINARDMGQFERTLIIVDEGAYVHYVEGCTAPIYSSDSLHSAVVEIIVKRGARCRYTTTQNWSNNRDF